MNPESFEVKNSIEPEKVPEKATDIELALFLIGHIDNPCEAEVVPGVKENIRGFYIKMAEESLEKMSNENAKDLLKSKIKEYEE
ncbi:MAG: hypothetical protein FJZ43_01200 [Candidatus Staskawiczbacteria bacterium]|nr:hypothetical protein [Candidatus Staskawiczbacteria bacterium]